MYIRTDFPFICIKMYNDFSKFYDLFAYDIPYDKFFSYYVEIFEGLGIKPELVVDICCGTGSLTTLLSEKYDVIGIDYSIEMLDIARKKDKAGKILYLNQTMTDFELYGTVDAFISSLDSVNYLLSEEELTTHFKLIKNYLNDDGVYIFDISTCYKFKHILGDNSFVDERENVMFVWQNDYDNCERLNTMYLDIFYRENGRYGRISETHYERGYTISHLSAVIKKCGLKVINIFDDLSPLAHNKTSERVFFVVGK